MRSVTITETDYSGWANMFKAKTFSRARVEKPGLIGSGSSNRVKAFSIVRAGRLGQVKLGLTSGKAKTLPRASFSLILQPGLG
jgi:hypothetical protein